MSDKLDYFIYDDGFVGPGYVVFGVPNAPAVPWNNDHKGWDFHIPSVTQFILTSMSVEDAATQATHKMLQDDGALRQLPYKTPKHDSPYAAVGPRSGPLSVDIGPGKYVEFWTYSPMTLCDPCPTDQAYPAMTTWNAVEEAVKTEILRRIKTGEIPLSSLEVQDAQ